MAAPSIEMQASAPPGDERPELRFQLIDSAREVDARY